MKLKENRGKEIKSACEIDEDMVRVRKEKRYK